MIVHHDYFAEDFPYSPVQAAGNDMKKNGA